MASLATIFAVVMACVWRLLKEQPFNRKLGLYDRFFTSLPLLREIAAAASLSFAPGLLEVLHAASPPSVAWLKKLPTNKQYAWDSDNWAVYLLVLEKDGSRTRCYIGSGTNSDTGLAFRWKQYDNKERLPSNVEASLDDGFKIVHKGLLCWIPMPSAAQKPISRLLIVALEATFTYLLWTMAAGTRDESMRYFSPFSDPEYDGLCSHCALIDPLARNFDLTEEQLEAEAELAEKKFRLHKANAATNYHYKQMETNYDEYIGNAIDRKMKSRELNPELDRIAERKRVDKIKEEKRFYCSICDVAVTRQKVLDDHLRSKAHARQLDYHKSKFKCRICVRGFSSEASLKRHRKESEAHREKVRLAAEAAQAAQAGPAAGGSGS